MAGKRTKESAEETSAVTFARLGKARTNKAIRQIRTLRALNRYEHTKEQSQRIVAVLTAEVETVATALASKPGAAADLFEF